MLKRTGTKLYTVGEEVGNAVTHGIGAALGVWGLVLMILKSIDAWQMVTSCVYGASIIVLFAMSCLYHAISHEGAKRIMRVFDHTSIFILIAGTYTPYTLVALRGVIGWVLFGVVWSAAIVGIVLNAISIERFKVFSMICYIAAGWCVVFTVVPLLRRLPLSGFWLLLGGGILYTVGLLFYRQKNILWCHTIWHVFVLAAAVIQFLSIYGYVLG